MKAFQLFGLHGSQAVLLPADGWGVFVRVDDAWQSEDEMEVISMHSDISRKPLSAHFKVSEHPEIVGTTLQQGWPRLLERWSVNRQNPGSFIGLKLHIHTKT